jgi:hypothetical protein
MESVEILELEGSRSFSFTLDGGFTKTVTVERQGRQVCICSHYRDGDELDVVEERFEAEGTVTLTLSGSGLYIASVRSVLSDRVRLRRMRFF